MATAAARAPKRELAPDWRDALRASCGALPCAPGARCWSRSASPARSRSPPTARPTRRFSTAAGGPPANWLGSFGAYASDALLLLFGLGSVLFLPVIAIAGLRMMRLEPPGGSAAACCSRRSARC
jgi:S-DNA-T family DNA segregation ATPase FtsK/SpoIIIE